MVETLVLSSHASHSITHADTIVVATPLDAIRRLEAGSSITRVVLGGTFARNDELVLFLADFYPAVRLEQER